MLEAASVKQPGESTDPGGEVVRGDTQPWKATEIERSKGSEDDPGGEVDWKEVEQLQEMFKKTCRFVGGQRVWCHFEEAGTKYVTGIYSYNSRIL